MKKIAAYMALIAGFVCLVLLAPQNAHAAGDVAINATNFPDSTFRQYVKDNFDKNKDNTLSSAEIKSATDIDVSYEQISSLKGLEHLTNLQKLNCYDNQLTSLNVTKNTALIDLRCGSNQLTSLDVSKNTALQNLYCGYNQLKTLDVTKNTAMTFLDCSGNRLTSLDFTNNTALQYLFCDDNQLKSLNVTKNTALEYLSCRINWLSSLDVTKNIALKTLHCEVNLLTTLEVTKNTALTTLYCGDNQLTTLDVTKNTALTDLACEINHLALLNVTKNTALTVLSCGSNQLTSLNVTKNTELISLYCYNNQLTSLDISKNPALGNLYCDMNQLKKLDLFKCPILLNLYKTWPKEESQGIITISGDNYYEGCLRYDKATIVKTDENPFIDVKRSDSYYDAVMWAVENGITSGTSATTFSPYTSCTRYQFAVMLYKLNGKPAVGNVALPFTDVKKTDSYYNAVAWAYTNGIISGTSKTTFSPKAEVTRYQVVQMLYKSVGKPSISTTTNPFKDVKKTDSYYKAVLWAVEKGITKGTSSTTFSPKATCKRYQMVVFLKKFNDQYHIK